MHPWEECLWRTRAAWDEYREARAAAEVALSEYYREKDAAWAEYVAEMAARKESSHA